MSNVQLIGDKKLRNLLELLPSKAANKRVWNSIARAAAKPIVESAKSKVNRKSGDLKRAIKYKSYRRALGGYVAVNTKKRNDHKWFTNKKLATVLAFGAKKERVRKSGGKTGDIETPIRDFIKEAGKENAIEVHHFMQKKAIESIQREIKKLL
jgi:hypothetical protein